MIRLANLLISRHNKNVYFYFDYNYVEINKHIEIAVSSGHHVFDKSTDYLSSPSDHRFNLNFYYFRIILYNLCINKFKNIINKISPKFLILSIIYLNKYFLVKKIISKVNPFVLILPESNIAYTTDFFIKECNCRSIPSVIVPFTMANEREIAEAYLNNEDYKVQKFFDYFIYIFYKKWVLTYKGKKLLPLSAAEIIIKELLKLSPPRPWVINSGDATALAVESLRMLEYYRQAGLKEDRLVLTGSIADDSLYSTRSTPDLKNQIYLQHHFNPDLPLVLCSLPPDQIRAGRFVDEFDDYETLVDFWVKSLLQFKNFNLLIKLHPRMSIDSHSFINGYGCAISQLDTTSLIPLCDFYVASVSSTIRWAIACGKPVLNYDVYKYNYDDFSKVPGVVYCDSSNDFLILLNKFSTERDYFSSLCDLQQLESESWGCLDGNSGARICELIFTC
jgi:hypothetical protein